MAYYTKVGDYTPGTRARGLEIETEFDTIVTGFANVEAVVDADGALGKDLTGGAAYQLTGMVDAVNPQDYATLANVTAEVAGGGTPGNIPITSLGVGTATADQFVRINSGGTAVVGDTVEITDMSVGTATADQVLRINSAGTAVEGRGLLFGKNALYNGCVRVNQKAQTVYDAASDISQNDDDTMLLDGWRLLSDGNDIFDVHHETTAANLPEGAYAACKLDVETISKKGGIVQFIESENVARLFKQGTGTCSLSFKAKRTGSDMEIRAAVLAWDSTADTVTSDVVSAWGADGTTPTFATNWTAENTPANLGLSTSYQTFRIENISLNTASTTNLAVFIWVDTTTANAGEFVYITDVQLELGAKATDFEMAPYSWTLERCLRYMWARYIPNATSNSEFWFPGYVHTTTSYRAMVNFPVRMRSTPSLLGSGAGEWRGFAGVAGLNDAGAPAINNASEYGCLVLMAVSGGTDAEAGFFTTRADPAWLVFDANL